MKNLVGNLVLVHPDLMVDPAGKQGEVGMIAGADLESDTIVVSFPNNKIGSYATDALLVLKEPAEIHKLSMNNVLNMDKSTFKALLEVNMHQDSGRFSRLAEAYEIASKNEAVREWSMVSLEEKLTLSIDNEQKQQTQMGMER